MRAYVPARACVSPCEARLLSPGGFWTVCDPEQKPQFDVNDVCPQPLHTSSEPVAVFSNTSGTGGRASGATSHLPGSTLRFLRRAPGTTFFNFLRLFSEKVRQKKIQVSPPCHLHFSLLLFALIHTKAKVRGGVTDLFPVTTSNTVWIPNIWDGVRI